jgi:hypothetical protein
VRALDLVVANGLKRLIEAHVLRSEPVPLIKVNCSRRLLRAIEHGQWRLCGIATL